LFNKGGGLDGVGVYFMVGTPCGSFPHNGGVCGSNPPPPTATNAVTGNSTIGGLVADCARPSYATGCQEAVHMPTKKEGVFEGIFYPDGIWVDRELG